MNNKTIGATFLIAGTTIGAGMLALPMTSAAFGFYNSLFLLVGMWVYMLISACVTVEISKGKGQSIAALADQYLGAWAKRLATACLLVLFWSLLWCYISGGSSILGKEFLSQISPTQSILLFAGVLSFFVSLCTKATDYVNRALFMVKLFVFTSILYGLFTHVDSINITTSFTSSVSLASVIPIFFTAYGFHGSLPSLITYLDGNKRNIYISLIAGSVIPLIVYILWQVATLGVLGHETAMIENVGTFIGKLSQKTHAPYLSKMTAMFAFLAIATSFLGVALALFDFISEWFVSAKNNTHARIKTSALTFLLPIALTFIEPNGFIQALGCAAVALSMLAIILPCCVAYKQAKTSWFHNRFVLGIILSGGLIVIAIELLTKN